MATPHKWKDVIVAWSDGEAIQYKAPCDTKWSPYSGSFAVTPDFSNAKLEWRIKPVTVKYRLAMVEHNNLVLVRTESSEKDVQNSWGFVKWITDWLEVEV